MKLLSCLAIVFVFVAQASAQCGPWGCGEQAAFGVGWGGPQLFERSGGSSFEWRQREWSTPQEFSGGWAGGFERPVGAMEFAPRWGGGGWPQLTFAPQITVIGRSRDRSPFVSGGLFTLGGRRTNYENGGAFRGAFRGGAGDPSGFYR
jgi:hypothetical protein